MPFVHIDSSVITEIPEIKVWNKIVGYRVLMPESLLTRQVLPSKLPISKARNRRRSEFGDYFALKSVDDPLRNYETTG